MTNEEMQRMMEFILEQQAKFTVNIDLLRENVDKLSTAQQRTDETVAQMARAQTHMNEVVAAIADAEQRTEVKFTELAVAQAHTDERLNSLIEVVERYFSEGRNGNAKG